LVDSLTEKEAEEVEWEEIRQRSDTLVNWMRPTADTDLQDYEQYNELRKMNVQLIRDSKSLEKKKPEEAVKGFLEAIANIERYTNLNMDHAGLVGRLQKEYREEFGDSGDIVALDRLTLCLVRLGRGKQAYTETQIYFQKYKMDLQLKAAKAITKRVEKAVRN
jgi:hypothetical protein